jgi:hypothetical protein
MAVIRLLPTSENFAAGTLTFAGNAANNETVTIGTRVYTWKSTLTGAANEVKVGASTAVSTVNLAAAINRDGASEGTLFGTGTGAHAQVTAVSTETTVVVTARKPSPSFSAGSVATTETMGSGSWGATTLTVAGATSSAAPTASDDTAGVPLPFNCDYGKFMLVNTDVVSGTTKTATGTLWGWNPAVGNWLVIGAVASGGTIAESISDRLLYTELIVGLRGFARLYFQIGALGGAGTEVWVGMDCVPANTTTT